MALLVTFDESEFDSYLDSMLVLDQSRKEFLNDTKTTLVALCSGSLTLCNGFRRLLLGLRGVGKTTLLKQIGVAARRATKEQLIVCEITYNSERKCELPSTSMFRSLPWTAKAHHTLKCRRLNPTDINQTMQELGLRMIVIVDELENVYHSNFLNGKSVIDELYEVGDLNGAAIHCILSGSSSDLRELAFGKLPHEKKERYGNYTGRCINSTKFIPYWIYPFSNRDDFIRAVKHMENRFPRSIQEDSGEQLLEDEWNGIFIQTGGIGRHIEEFAKNGSCANAYSASAKNYLANDCVEKRILVSLYRCLSPYSVGSKMSVFEWMASVPVSSLLASEPADKKTLYKMGDQGLIRYFDKNHEIAFANPLVFWETRACLHNQEQMRLTFDELHHLALFRHSTSAQKAEGICLRFLAEKSDVWCNFKSKFTVGAPIQPLYLPELEGLPDDVVGRLWKETLRDKPMKAAKVALGADATLIEKTDGEKYVVHRLRLKLGSGRGTKVVEDTVIAFKNNAATAQKIYDAAGFIGHEQRWYLAATHDFDPDDRANLAKNHITLIDRQLLANVWPVQVKTIVGRPYA